MSKLLDKLNRASKAMPQPMGFRTAQPVSTEVKMLLIASLTQANDVDRLADYVAGADAVLLPISKLSPRAKTLEKIARSLSDIPWGGWLEDIGRSKLRPVVEAGCDFMVFPAASTVLAIPQDDKVGKVLQVETSLSEGLIKAISELPVDAVLIVGEQKGEYSLTWHHLMLFQRFADLLTKPLLVSIPSSVTADELQTLWEIGVDGVVVEVGVGQPMERLKELRQAIDKSTFPSPRKREEVKALLPRIGEEPGVVTETEEEEE